MDFLNPALWYAASLAVMILYIAWLGAGVKSRLARVIATMAEELPSLSLTRDNIRSTIFIATAVAVGSFIGIRLSHLISQQSAPTFYIVGGALCYMTLERISGKTLWKVSSIILSLFIVALGMHHPDSPLSNILLLTSLIGVSSYIGFYFSRLGGIIILGLMTIDDMLTIATQLYQDIARNILSGSSHSSAQGSISSFEFPDYLVAGHDGLGNGDLVFSVIALCLIYRFVGLRATLLAASLFVFSDISLHVVTWYAQAHHLSFPFLFYIGPITILILIFGQPNLAQSEIFCYYGLKIY